MLNTRFAKCSFAGAAAILVLVFLGLSGCTQKPVRPMVKTFPVKGRVVAPPGRLTKGSNIMFEPANAQTVARAIIADDGSFTLTTVFHESKLPGAVEGEHRVTINPAIIADGDGEGAAIVLKNTYKVEPKENDFTIKVH